MAPTSSAAALPTDHVGTDAAQTDLIATLHPRIATTCKPYQMYDDAVAAVVCDRPGNLVWYVRYPTKASMDAAYEATREYAGVQRDSGTCKGGVVSEGAWNFPRATGEAVVDQGRLMCRIADDGTAFIDFTTDATLTIGSLVDIDGKLSALYDAWVDDDIVPIVP